MRNSIDKHRIKSKGDREALLEKLLDFRKNKNTYGIGMDIDEQLRILQQVPSLGGGEECITLIRNLAIVKATARIDCEPYPYEEEDPGDKYITEVPGLMIQTSDVFGSVYSLTPPISGNGKENHERLERIVDDMKASLRFLNIDEIKYNSLFQERVIVWQKEKQNDSEAALDQERYEWVVRTGSSKIGMPLTEADRECLKSKMKEHCVNPEYMDAAIQNKDIRYLNLGSVNELIFSYQVENRLIAPVKRTPVADCIFFGTHTDHHTVKWNGKEWEGFDFDENQEIDVYRGFGEYYCNVLVKEFRLKDSGLSIEEIQRTPPDKLTQKGLWDACDYYQECNVRVNPLIKLENFDTAYCRYYQYINDRCPIEVMLSRDKT